MHIIVRIKEALKENNVSIVELARRLGVSRQTVHYYIEQGDKNPIAQLEKIAEAIGCKMSALFEQDVDSDNGGIACPHCGAVLHIEVKPNEDGSRETNEG